MAELQIEMGFATDVGLQRQRNEDSYAIYAPFPGDENLSLLRGVLVVADGMGGAEAGDVASRLAAERLRQWLASGEFLAWPEATSATPVADALRRAIPAVSAEIHSLGVADARIRGLGSTVVLTVFEHETATIAHVGDSRCYRVRDDRIERMTRDHSWAEQQVAAGVITAEQARVHERRNVLTRSLGDETPPAPDVRIEPLLPGDCFILCSDGLTGRVIGEEILAQARLHPSSQMLAEALVRLANERDGSDNVTVVVGRCHAESLPATVAAPAEPRPEEQSMPEGRTPEGRNPEGRNPEGRIPKLAIAATLVAGLLLGWFAHLGWEWQRRIAAYDAAERTFNAGSWDQAREQLRNLLTDSLGPYRAERTFDMLETLESTVSKAPGEVKPATADQEADPGAEEPAAGDPAAGDPAAGDPAAEASDSEGNRPTPTAEEPE